MPYVDVLGVWRIGRVGYGKANSARSDTVRLQQQQQRDCRTRIVPSSAIFTNVRV